ncbi:ethylbenzene dehydrogenase-related protein, partial [Candidatus Albibeggiatoa sp. nov. BB20]|uniref:ethylbenzene dehydrogenase-related protein n=1 Tax=Candidatus Albibeggiatoa sp. nov. BB20 TaxID=3162723 RepID=UPI003365782D
MKTSTQFCFGLLALSSSIVSAAPAMQLTAQTTENTIVIDGQIDDTWKQATPIRIELNETPYKPSNGYAGVKSTEVELRALYDKEFIYMLVHYADPTESLQRFPWEKQPNGTWKQLENRDDTGNDNTYYEDKFALLWNINTRGFKKKGCDQSCHMKEDSLVDGIPDSSSGRHFTRNQGEVLDAWHWKSARTNPNFQMDDQYFNSDRKAQNKSWGRHSDVKTGGGYVKNINQDKTAPEWMSKEANPESAYWIHERNKV